MIPTKIKDGAVACDGTTDTSGENKAVNANKVAVTTLVSPVLPPAPIPAVLSTNVVMLEVPSTAPKAVAIESERSALSIFVWIPLHSIMACSSS